MFIYGNNDCKSPIVTPHGETIRELVGRAVPEPTDIHSVAHVLIPSGKSTLLHHHPNSEESYYILAGQGELHVNEEVATVNKGQIALIRAGEHHKIFSVGDVALEMMVVCVPAWEPTNTVWLEGPETSNLRHG